MAHSYPSRSSHSPRPSCSTIPHISYQCDHPPPLPWLETSHGSLVYRAHLAPVSLNQADSPQPPSRSANRKRASVMTKTVSVIHRVPDSHCPFSVLICPLSNTQQACQWMWVTKNDLLPEGFEKTWKLSGSARSPLGCKQRWH